MQFGIDPLAHYTFGQAEQLKKGKKKKTVKEEIENLGRTIWQQKENQIIAIFLLRSDDVIFTRGTSKKIQSTLKHI